MTSEVVLTIFQEAFILILQLSTPVLLVAIVVGLIISIFQSVTQIQEQTLTFVPKIIACVITLILCLPWMLNIFISATNNFFFFFPLLLI